VNKPKCFLCGKKGDSPYFYWVERRGGGFLAHDECVEEVNKMMRKAIEKKENKESVKRGNNTDVR
jgi:hypothetical protein